MSIFVDRFGFLNFDRGWWGVQIRNQRLRKLPSTEFHLNQFTFGILIRLIRSDGPSCPTCNKNYRNVHLNLQFIDKQNLDTFIYQVIYQ